jgi:hypothetical protein
MSCFAKPSTQSVAESCGESGVERAAYYPGQFLTDRDLSADQTYLANKRMRHNQILHGYGIACGLEVTVADQRTPWLVTIQPGMALDQYGREIQVCHAVHVDLQPKMADCLRRPMVTNTNSYLHRAANPYMPTDAAVLSQPFTVVALRYEEWPAEPQPAFAAPASCCEATTGYARVREGYCVDVLAVQDLDAGCLESLVWTTDLSRMPHDMADVMACPTPSCAYVFLAMARPTANGPTFEYSRLVRRPVMTAPLLMELNKAALLRPYTVAPTTNWVDLVSINVQLKDDVARLKGAFQQLTSPAYRIAQKQIGDKVQPYQEHVTSALAVSAAEAVTLSEVPELAQHAGALAAQGINSLADLLNGGGNVAAALGKSAPVAMAAGAAVFTKLADGAANFATETGAANVEAVADQPALMAASLRLGIDSVNRTIGRMRQYHL